MRVTYRAWTLAALAVVLTAWAVVVERPLLLVVAGGVWAWISTQQYRFARAVGRAADGIAVDQRLSSETVVTGGETHYGLTVTTGSDVGVHVYVEPSPPVTSNQSVDAVHVPPDERTAETSEPVTWPVAGVFEFDAPEVTVVGPRRLFEQRFRRGSRLRVTVNATRPTEIHVGEGGDQVAAGFGDHDADRVGEGSEPLRVREYVPGDPIRQIDWKATARFNVTHVREFRGEADRRTVLFVDHRASMGVGPDGSTKLSVARELALAITETARTAVDPLGCYTVREGGLSGVFDPRSRTGQYDRIRRHLWRLEATSDRQSDPPPTDATGLTDHTRSDGSATLVGPTAVRTAERRLAATDASMTHRLEPFLGNANAVVEQLAEKPLFEAIETVGRRLGGSPWTVIVTDDSNRVELREAVRRVRHRGGAVLVLLLPDVLFETGTLGDLDRAYHRYASFEEYRSELAHLDGVSAFEVGPADRLETILSYQDDHTTGDHKDGT